MLLRRQPWIDFPIRGGENIHPAELENLLADCAAIAEAAVIGLDDPNKNAMGKVQKFELRRAVAALI